MEMSFLQDVSPQLPPRKTSQAKGECLSVGVAHNQSEGQTTNSNVDKALFRNSEKERESKRERKREREREGKRETTLVRAS